jgi:hypothetical protein
LNIRTARRPARFGEDPEHAPLIVGPEVKEAVPSENSIKPLTERREPHVTNDPLVTWHALATQRNQARGRVDTCHG